MTPSPILLGDLAAVQHRVLERHSFCCLDTFMLAEKRGAQALHENSTLCTMLVCLFCVRGMSIPLSNVSDQTRPPCLEYILLAYIISWHTVSYGVCCRASLMKSRCRANFSKYRRLSAAHAVAQAPQDQSSKAACGMGRMVKAIEPMRNERRAVPETYNVTDSRGCSA